jgi:hypothetical protein
MGYGIMEKIKGMEVREQKVKQRMNIRGPGIDYSISNFPFAMKTKKDCKEHVFEQFQCTS